MPSPYTYKSRLPRIVDSIRHDFTDATESTSPTTGAITVAGGVGIAKRLNVDGLITAEEGVKFSGGTRGAGRLVKDSAYGVNLRGDAGSSYDFSLESAAGDIFGWNPTGTSYFDAAVRTSGASHNRNISDRFKDQFYNVKEFGATGDGTTDDTARFTAAVAAISTKGTLFVPPGTYILDNCIVNKDVMFILAHGATLKHKGTATNDMLRFTVAQSGGIVGGIIDGNKSEQTLNTVAGRKKCVTYYSNGSVIRDVTFQNHVWAAFWDEQMLTSSTIERCRFLEGAEQGGNDAVQLAIGVMASCGIAYYFGTRTTESRPIITIRDCEFIQVGEPTLVGAAPGGILIQGRDANNVFPNAVIDNCYFEGIGQNINGAHVGSIDGGYEDMDGVIITNCRVRRPRYIVFKLQTSSRIIATNNIVWCDADFRVTDGTALGVFYIDFMLQRPGHPNTTRNESCIISHNHVVDATATMANAIIVQGVNDEGREVIISENKLANVNGGITLQGNFGIEGNVIIDGNIVTVVGSGYSALSIGNFSGRATISDNHLSGGSAGHGILANGILASATLRFDNNYCETSGAGFYPFAVFRCGKLFATSNHFNAIAGGFAVRIEASGGTNIGLLRYEQNYIEAGTLNIPPAGVTKIMGSFSYSGNPEGVWAADVGTEFRRTDGGASTTHYIKESGSTNTGWKAVLTGPP